MIDNASLNVEEFNIMLCLGIVICQNWFKDNSNLLFGTTLISKHKKLNIVGMVLFNNEKYADI